MIDVTIGIVTFNGKMLLADCLDSIVAARPACTYEIVVVDNASSDGTVEWLTRDHPEVRLIVNDANYSVTRGNNQCLAAARGRYTLLLNNDTLMLPGMLDDLVAFGDAHPDAGALGGKLLNADGSFQASYFDFPNLPWEFLHVTRLWTLFDRFKTYPSHEDDPGIRQVDWLCSASLMIRTEAARAVGGVDESYFMYSDETDLQYRLQRAGWQVYYLPEAATIHLGGKSASHWQRRKLIYRGKLLFFQKHYGPLPNAGLRTLFAAFSAAKLPVWGLLSLLPSKRQRALNEIRSDVAVLKMSLAPDLQGNR